MQDKPADQHHAIKQRMLKIFHSIPPGEDRHETFLTMLHGPGWKERALAPDAPLMLVNALRILDIDKRLRRIETHLGLGPLPE
jgi:hypothetical protein